MVGNESEPYPPMSEVILGGLSTKASLSNEVHDRTDGQDLLGEHRIVSRTRRQAFAKEPEQLWEN